MIGLVAGAALAWNAEPLIAGEAAQDALAETALVRALSDDSSSIVNGPKLTVRDGYDPRMIVTDKCQGAGERELRHLAETASVEEAFAYVPDLCAWVDIGADQTETSVRVDRRAVDQLAKAFRKIVVYHTHVGRLGDHALYLPAYVDLIGAVLIGSGHLADDGIEIHYRAITPIGVIAYRFEPSERAVAALETLHRTGLSRFAGENLSMFYRGSEHESQYQAAVQDCFGGRERFVACFPLKVLDFVLEFTSGPISGSRVDAAALRGGALR